jgi:phage tail tape-measure protein
VRTEHDARRARTILDHACSRVASAGGDVGAAIVEVDPLIGSALRDAVVDGLTQIVGEVYLQADDIDRAATMYAEQDDDTDRAEQLEQAAARLRRVMRAIGFEAYQIDRGEVVP